MIADFSRRRYGLFELIVTDHLKMNVLYMIVQVVVMCIFHKIVRCLYVRTEFSVIGILFKLHQLLP